MLDYAELIDRLERLPANEAACALAGTDVSGSNNKVDRCARALACLKGLFDHRRARGVVAESEIPAAAAEVQCADQLLERIENEEACVRLVPDWGDDLLKKWRERPAVATNRQRVCFGSRKVTYVTGIHLQGMVAKGGIEPPTQGFSVLCSTN